MNKLKRILFAAAILLLALTANTANAYFACGIEPIEMKPIPPIGCTDVYHACTCDSQGNCRWIWVCVK